MAEPVITTRGLLREYQRRRPGFLERLRGNTDAIPTVTAVRDVDLDVYPGEIVALAGPSGSGKTTLLHLIAALDTPTEGEVIVDGTPLSTLSSHERTALRLRSVGMVFQRFHLLPSLSARANVALPLVEQGVAKSTRRGRATQRLEQVGLDDRITHTPGQLSGGEQQRVAIARALVTDPAVIIADEPTGELDTETGAAVLDAFEQIAADGRAVLVASHDEATLARADRLIRMRDGAIVQRDTGVDTRVH